MTKLPIYPNKLFFWYLSEHEKSGLIVPCYYFVQFQLAEISSQRLLLHTPLLPGMRRRGSAKRTQRRELTE